MKRYCPKTSCKSDKIIKDGSYQRRGDSRKVQRFKCKSCGKRFGASTHTLEYQQQKRRINSLLLKLLCSKVSQRRAALILGVHRETIRRRVLYWGEKARLKNKRFMHKLARTPVEVMQFDDLITKENSKLKPLSISISVDAHRRFILGAEVSQIEAFGHLAKIAKKKHGRRDSLHKEGLDRLFRNTKEAIEEEALIRSDEHQNYKAYITEYFPRARYQQFRSERGCIVGQGELKKVGYDPIFMINHTCALFRDNINRLVRKTWCTTKDPTRLKDFLDMFIYFYNQIYLKKQGLFLTPNG